MENKKVEIIPRPITDLQIEYANKDSKVIGVNNGKAVSFEVDKANGLAKIGNDGKLNESVLPKIEIDSQIQPINLSTETPTKNGVFEPLEVGVYTNFGGLELTQQEKDSSIVYFYLLNGVFSKQVKSVSITDVVGPNNTNAISSRGVYNFSIRNVSNIAELRTIVGEDGQKVNLLGYYEAGDKPSLLYEWVSGTAEYDGGSVIVANGGYWSACFADSVDIRDFGVKSGFSDYNIINSVLLKATSRNISVKFCDIQIEIDSSRTWIDTPSGIMPPSNSVIYFNNSTITQKTTDSKHYSILNIHKVNNVRIYGDLILYGDKETHTGIGGEWGYGLAIWESDNISIDNVYSYDMWGDGVNIDGDKRITNRNINIKNIFSKNTRRQGVSISNCDVLNIDNINVFDVLGTDPQSGVDIEPNIGMRTTNIFINNLYVKNASNQALAIPAIQNNVLIENVNINNIIAEDCGGVETIAIYGLNKTLPSKSICRFINIGNILVKRSKSSPISIVNQVSDVNIGSVVSDNCFIPKKNLIFIFQSDRINIGNLSALNTVFDVNVTEPLIGIVDSKDICVKIDMNNTVIPSNRFIISLGAVNNCNLILSNINYKDALSHSFYMESVSDINININNGVFDNINSLFTIKKVDRVSINNSNINVNGNNLFFVISDTSADTSTDVSFSDNFIKGSLNKIFDCSGQFQEKMYYNNNRDNDLVYTQYSSRVINKSYILSNIGKDKILPKESGTINDLQQLVVKLKETGLLK